MLELAKMAEDYSLHVVAGRVKGENKGDSILVLGGPRCLDLFGYTSPQTSQVVQWLASQHQGPRFDSQLGNSVWSLHVLPVSVWISSRCSGFLPQSKDVLVRRLFHLFFLLSPLPCLGRGRAVGLPLHSTPHCSNKPGHRSLAFHKFNT